MQGTRITIVVADEDTEARNALFNAVASHAGLRVVDVRTSAGEDVPAAPREPLTSREKEVLALVAGGHSNAQIGERLSLSSATVRNHVTTILAKLGVANRTQAAAWALRAGLPAAAEPGVGDSAMHVRWQSADRAPAVPHAPTNAASAATAHSETGTREIA